MKADPVASEKPGPEPGEDRDFMPANETAASAGAEEDDANDERVRVLEEELAAKKRDDRPR